MHSAVQAEAFITSLVFDHALKVRMKAETSKAGPTSKSSGKQNNLHGRIHNLVTSDLNNIVNGRKIMLTSKSLHSLYPPSCIHSNPVVSAPVEIGLSGCFLWSLLGWRFACKSLSILRSLISP